MGMVKKITKRYGVTLKIEQSSGRKNSRFVIQTVDFITKEFKVNILIENFSRGRYEKQC